MQQQQSLLGPAGVALQRGTVTHGGGTQTKQLTPSLISCCCCCLAAPDRYLGHSTAAWLWMSGRLLLSLWNSFTRVFSRNCLYTASSWGGLLKPCCCCSC